jgi:selenocysteine lyase/cysteine desulfurase
MCDIDLAFLARMITAGGDRRIWVPAGSDVNIYGASPFPREMLGLSASTANDISIGAFAHLQRVVAQWEPGHALDGAAYAAALETLRARIRKAYALHESVNIVFAPSGTDLEYVALHLARARSAQPVTNILLGADEVGSGCILSAQGRYFASETALVERLDRGTAVAGLADTIITDIPVRHSDGRAKSSSEIGKTIAQAAHAAHTEHRHPLAHIVHGSKTALILPAIDTVDALHQQFGKTLSLVVDACQARISATSLNAYLERDAIVLMTGSKFMGGPPFSGFALIPPNAATDKPLPAGLAHIFRRGEWPHHWAGCDALPNDANPGLLLRLEAALFELDRFTTLAPASRKRVIAGFAKAVENCAERLGVRLITSNAGGTKRRLENATLATLDLSVLPCRPDFAMAQRWQRVLAARGIRVGQPVKCVKLPDGRWGGTLRLSLSMPLIVALAELDPNIMRSKLDQDMARITSVLHPAMQLTAA